MSLYTDYLSEIETRKEQGLHPKPIDDGALVKEIVAQIKDAGNEHRDESLNFLHLQHAARHNQRRRCKGEVS